LSTAEQIDSRGEVLSDQLVIWCCIDRFWSNDLDGKLGRVDSSTGLIYICNPNNPTAILNPRDELETFIGKLPGNVRVIIDEAYHHYPGILPRAHRSSTTRWTTNA
jgi:histidinol-phosphate/aromatic aminotransferase/cobyric acid decarboxylase-like protein